MSLLKKLAQKLAGESGELKKIREEAEHRRSAKSSQSLPKVQDEQHIDKTIDRLAERIERESNRFKKPKI
jgi:hypothetical protein